MIQYQLHYIHEVDIIGLRDLAHYKIQYDRVLCSSDFSETFYYVVRLGNIPDFLCTAPHAPDYDFAGNVLQDLYDELCVVHHFTFSLIATERGGAIVFSWLGKAMLQSNLLHRFIHLQTMIFHMPLFALCLSILRTFLFLLLGGRV